MTPFKKLVFTIEIKASAEKVWDVLWNPDSYRKWTSVFTEGSHYVGDLLPGSRVQFLDGKGNGMFSRVEENNGTDKMVFVHLGDIVNGTEVEQPWAGVKEGYELEPHQNGVRLSVTHDAMPEFEDFFQTQFPKAIQKIKELCEP